MRVFAHPLRIDAAGGFSTVEQGSAAQAGQLVQAILSTITGERLLAPDFGVADPSGVGCSADALLAAVALCEPDVEVVGLDVKPPDVTGQQNIAVSVQWRTEET